MYIKLIYDNWQLHPDATQLEVNYKFLTSFVDIADTKRLTTVAGEDQTITDPQVLTDWKLWRYEQLYKDFRQISTTNWPDNDLFNHDSYLVRCLFILPFILNALKTTNYKASELEIYFEPRIFSIACHGLELSILEEWVSVLYLRLTNLEAITTPPVVAHPCDWKINYMPKYFKNTIWFLDNLSLTFNDIFAWFETQIENLKNDATKTSVINIMNHFIVYALTDFYLKYYIEINTTGFNKNAYNYFLTCINKAINDHSFAFLSYEAIASFLGLLLANQLIAKDDALIHSFIKIINISSSTKNREKFHALMEATNYEKIPTDAAPNPAPTLAPAAPQTPADSFSQPTKQTEPEESIDDFLEDLIK